MEHFHRSLQAIGVGDIHCYMHCLNDVLHFYQTQVSLGCNLWVRFSLPKRRFANLTDLTLADEDTN